LKAKPRRTTEKSLPKSPIPLAQIKLWEESNPPKDHGTKTRSRLMPRKAVKGYYMLEQRGDGYVIYKTADKAEELGPKGNFQQLGKYHKDVAGSADIFKRWHEDAKSKGLKEVKQES
jgi:hypothetical protein